MISFLIGSTSVYFSNDGFRISLDVRQRDGALLERVVQYAAESGISPRSVSPSHLIAVGASASTEGAPQVTGIVYGRISRYINKFTQAPLLHLFGLVSDTTNLSTATSFLPFDPAVHSISKSFRLMRSI